MAATVTVCQTWSHNVVHQVHIAWVPYIGGRLWMINQHVIRLLKIKINIYMYSNLELSVRGTVYLHVRSPFLKTKHWLQTVTVAAIFAIQGGKLLMWLKSEPFRGLLDLFVFMLISAHLLQQIMTIGWKTPYFSTVEAKELVNLFAHISITLQWLDFKLQVQGPKLWQKSSDRTKFELKL
jgi:hypothetical protein